MADPIVDATMVRDWVLSTVHEWWPGYTDVLGDGKQRKLRVEQVAEDHLVVSVQTMGNHGPNGLVKQYKVAVEVTEDG